MSPLPLENRAFVLWVYDGHRHLDPPANGQAVIYLTGLLEVFISESLILATVSDNSARYQAKLRATHTTRQNVPMLWLSPQYTSVNQVMLGSIFRIDEDYSARCDFNCLSYSFLSGKLMFVKPRLGES